MYFTFLFDVHGLLKLAAQSLLERLCSNFQNNLKAIPRSGRPISQKVRKLS